VDTPPTSQVREWARRQGVPVGDRGRLPAGLVAQYLAAHGSVRTSTAKPSPPQARRPADGDVVIGRTVSAKPRWDWKR
jgi:ATP-dependent DNA helicase PIF1